MRSISYENRVRGSGVILSALLLLGSCGGSVTGAPCRATADCPSGEQCVSDRCRLFDDERDMQCLVHTDCPAGLECEGGACEPQGGGGGGRQ
jgi:hypothetical protein